MILKNNDEHQSEDLKEKAHKGTSELVITKKSFQQIV